MTFVSTSLLVSGLIRLNYSPTQADYGHTQSDSSEDRTHNHINYWNDHRIVSVLVEIVWVNKYANEELWYRFCFSKNTINNTSLEGE